MASPFQFPILTTLAEYSFGELRLIGDRPMKEVITVAWARTAVFVKTDGPLKGPSNFVRLSKKKKKSFKLQRLINYIDTEDSQLGKSSLRMDNSECSSLGGRRRSQPHQKAPLRTYASASASEAQSRRRPR